MGDNGNGGKPKILGTPHEISDEEAEGIAQMIQEAQHSARQQTIPAEDLSESATTTMAPEVERVISESHVRDILRRFNRDFLYSQGRFDEYSGGMLLKWGDGYSRKHIWITVEGDNLLFQTSHERKCSKDYCIGGQHVFPPEMWHDVRQINAELAEQFQRPVQERTDD
jgi:hypothetical protein